MNKTGVSGDNASIFLKLVHNLIPITLDNTDASQNLGSNMKTMYDLLERRFTDQYSNETRR